MLGHKSCKLLIHAGASGAVSFSLLTVRRIIMPDRKRRQVLETRAHQTAGLIIEKLRENSDALFDIARRIRVDLRTRLIAQLSNISTCVIVATFFLSLMLFSVCILTFLR